MIRYTVKPDRADENAALVRAVYEEMRDVQPDIRYRTLRDGATFTHIADGGERLRELAAFRAFRETLDDRLESSLERTELQEVGRYPDA